MSLNETKNCITLRNSAQIICEYLNYSINSILFQRVLYPSRSFKVNYKYGLAIFTTEEPAIKNFLSYVLRQTEEWIVSGEVFKLSVIVLRKDSLEVLECWDFNILYEDGEPALCRMKNKRVGLKDLNKIHQEMREFILQVDNTMALLPSLGEECSFNVLVHVHRDLHMPENWVEIENISVMNPKTVQYNKTISTSLHRMQTNAFFNYKL